MNQPSKQATDNTTEESSVEALHWWRAGVDEKSNDQSNLGLQDSIPHAAVYGTTVPVYSSTMSGLPSPSAARIDFADQIQHLEDIVASLKKSSNAQSEDELAQFLNRLGALLYIDHFYCHGLHSMTDVLQAELTLLELRELIPPLSIRKRVWKALQCATSQHQRDCSSTTRVDMLSELQSALHELNRKNTTRRIVDC